MTAAQAYAARWDLSPYPTPRPIPIIPRQATAEVTVSYPSLTARPLVSQNSLPAHIMSNKVAGTPPAESAGPPQAAVSRLTARPSVSLDIPLLPASRDPPPPPPPRHSPNCAHNSVLVTT